MSWQKRKGSRFERLIVKIAQLRGFASKRAWASDGRSLGMHSEVDVVVDDFKIQAKCRKSLAKYLKPSEHVDWQVIKEDRGKVYVILEFDKLLETLADWCHGDKKLELEKAKKELDVQKDSEII